MDTLKVINERRSIREFQNKSIPQETIEAILELAMKAPSGKNRQPWRFVVLQDKRKDDLVNIMTDVTNHRKLQGLDIGSCEGSIHAMDQASVVILVFNAFSNFEKDYNHFRLLTDTQSMTPLIHSKIAS